jgi:opacity protein-like surface antigen
MRRLVFVLVATLTAVAATTATASAQATSVTEPVVITLTNPCNGEVVLVEGTIHYVTRENEDEGGGAHIFLHGVLRGTGVGLTSGAEYRVLDVGLDPGEANFGVDRASQATDVFVVHVIGTEPGTSFYSHINHHSGISASGQQMPFHINAHSACR